VHHSESNLPEVPAVSAPDLRWSPLDSSSAAPSIHHRKMLLEKQRIPSGYVKIAIENGDL